MTAALPMGNQKITGMADPTVSTDAVTKNYADALVAAFFSTGDVKLTLKTAADTGWILLTSTSFGNGTIGSAGSGANIRANVDCLNLFTLVYNNFQEADAPLFTSTGVGTTRAAQGAASTAWAANCRVQVGFFASRAIGVAGNPADLSTNRPLGAHMGVDTQTLVTANLPAYTPAGAIANGAITVAFNAANISSASGGGNSITTGNFSATGALNLNVATVGQGSTIFTGSAQGGSSTPLSVYQPTTFINAMVKL